MEKPWATWVSATSLPEVNFSGGEGAAGSPTKGNLDAKRRSLIHSKCMCVNDMRCCVAGCSTEGGPMRVTAPERARRSGRYGPSPGGRASQGQIPCGDALSESPTERDVPAEAHRAASNREGKLFPAVFRRGQRVRPTVQTPGGLLDGGSGEKNRQPLVLARPGVTGARRSSAPWARAGGATPLVGGRGSLTVA